jgi:hypothetical protein
VPDTPLITSPIMDDRATSSPAELRFRICRSGPSWRHRSCPSSSKKATRRRHRHRQSCFQPQGCSVQRSRLRNPELDGFKAGQSCARLHWRATIAHQGNGPRKARVILLCSPMLLRAQGTATAARPTIYDIASLKYFSGLRPRSMNLATSMAARSKSRISVTNQMRREP